MNSTNYIIMDLEWNQAVSAARMIRKPVMLNGEIIQIGAIKTDEKFNLLDRIKINVRPKYYKIMNPHVEKLTGITQLQLTSGETFPQAFKRFKEWCGDEFRFITWGFDDIGILRENLRLHALEEAWTDRWYNAQMIFNAQTDGSNSQKALKTAMETFGIEASRPAHDALGDAYHTALICAKLDLDRGTREYDQALKSHENGFHGAELPGCIDRKVFYDYADKRAALSAMAGCENICPVCGGKMLGSRWFAQPGRRYMDLATCPEDGKFLIRVRLAQQEDGLIRVSRLTYEATSEAAEAYARRAEKADPEEPARPRRRRKRGRSASAKKENETT